jgi:hypothetical protein
MPNNFLVSFPSWGIGHSTGLLLVGGIFIFKDYLQSKNGSNDSDDKNPIDIPDSVGHFFESLVGLFMLALGVYGFRCAFRKRREQQSGLAPETLEDGLVGAPNDNILEDAENAGPNIPRYRDDTPTEQYGLADPPMESFHDEVEEDPSQIVLEVDSYHESVGSNHDRTHTQRIKEWTQRFSTKTLALCAGIIHGLAGPGGVLGIVPAVQLHDYKLATCYLGSFCLSSTITMGLFACTYGTLSSCMGKDSDWKFKIQCFSSFLSVAVGVTWLVLLSLGKLEDVFP